IAEEVQPIWSSESVSVMTIYLEAGDYRSAIRYWNDIDEIKQILNSYEAIDYDDEAIVPHLNYLVEHLPGERLSLLDHLRKAYLVQNNIKAAINTLDQALKLDPDSTDLWTSLINIYLTNHDRDQAIALMDKRLTQTPTCINTWAKLFDVLLSAGETDEVLHR